MATRSPLFLLCCLCLLHAFGVMAFLPHAHLRGHLCPIIGRSIHSVSGSSIGGISISGSGCHSRQQTRIAAAESGGDAGRWGGEEADAGGATSEDDLLRDKNRTLSWGGFVSRLTDMVTKSKTWGAYSLSLTLRPLYTKALSSMAGFLLGDLLAQVLIVRRPFDLVRFVRMGFFGALIHAPSGHVFYGLLERRFPGVEARAIATKLAVDQLIWTPVFGSLLLAFAGITAGHSPSRIFRVIKTSLVKIVATSWALWPLAHTVNFRVITPKHRLLYINAVQVLYNVFLSLFANA